MKQTGHRSKDAVRQYKRPSFEHERQVSSILQPPAPKKMATSEFVSCSGQENIMPSSSTAAEVPPIFNFNVQRSATQNIYITYSLPEHKLLQHKLNSPIITTIATRHIFSVTLSLKSKLTILIMVWAFVHASDLHFLHFKNISILYW